MAIKRHQSDEFLIKVRADIEQATADLREFTSEIKGTGDAASTSNKNTAGMAANWRGLAAAAGAYISLRTVKNLIDEADAWNVLQQRIKTATRTTGDYTQRTSELYRVSQANGKQMDTTVSLFQNLARVAPELGSTNSEMIRLTNAVQQLGIISGTTQAHQRAGLLQFTQGLAAGVFRAEEFNSIIENLPELATRIASGMGMTVGQLRMAVLEGKVLSKDVFASIMSQTTEINQQFGALEDSTKRAGTAMEQSATRFLAAVNDFLNASGTLASVYRDIAERFDRGTALLTQDELGKAMEDRAVAMVMYQKLIAKGIDQEDDSIQRLLDKIDRLDQKIKDLNRGNQQSFDFVGPVQPLPEPVTPPVQIDPAEQKAIEDYQKSLAKLIDRLDPAAAKTRDLQAELDLLNQAFFENGDLSADQYDQLTESLLGASEAAQQATEEIDAMDRALDLIEQQFAELDEEEARAIAGLEEVGDKGEESFNRLEAAVRGWGDDFTNTLADMVADGKGQFSDLAASIIRDLLRIAIQQNITNRLFSMMGFPIAHSGGIAGQLTGSKTVNPLAFLSAPRYHSGGIAGLRPREVPAILEQGEEVLTRDDPRHIANRGGSMPVTVSISNDGTPQEITTGSAHMDAEGLQVQIFTRDMKTGGPMARSLQSTFNLNRGS